MSIDDGKRLCTTSGNSYSKTLVIKGKIDGPWQEPKLLLLCHSLFSSLKKLVGKQKAISTSIVIPISPYKLVPRNPKRKWGLAYQRSSHSWLASDNKSGPHVSFSFGFSDFWQHFGMPQGINTFPRATRLSWELIILTGHANCLLPLWFPLMAWHRIAIEETLKAKWSEQAGNLALRMMPEAHETVQCGCTHQFYHSRSNCGQSP